MELDEAVSILEKKNLRRVEGTYKGYKLVAYTICYENQTIFRIDIHNTKQKTMDTLTTQGESDLGT